MVGKLELMLGPMRSNKTAELLRRADMRRQYAGQYVMVLKPSDDTKGGPGVVESRNPRGHVKMNALEFNSNNPWEVLPAIKAREKEIAWSALRLTRASLSTGSSLSRTGCLMPTTTCWLRASISTFAQFPLERC